MKNNRFYNNKDLRELTGVSETKAYSLIREWNEELRAKGYTTLEGKVVRAYADRKLGFFINDKEDVCNA